MINLVPQGFKTSSRKHLNLMLFTALLTASGCGTKTSVGSALDEVDSGSGAAVAAGQPVTTEEIAPATAGTGAGQTGTGEETTTIIEKNRETIEKIVEKVILEKGSDIDVEELKAEILKEVLAQIPPSTQINQETLRETIKEILAEQLTAQTPTLDEEALNKKIEETAKQIAEKIVEERMKNLDLPSTREKIESYVKETIETYLNAHPQPKEAPSIDVDQLKKQITEEILKKLQPGMNAEQLKEHIQNTIIRYFPEEGEPVAANELSPAMIEKIEKLIRDNLILAQPQPQEPATIPANQFDETLRGFAEKYVTIHEKEIHETRPGIDFEMVKQKAVETAMKELVGKEKELENTLQQRLYAILDGLTGPQGPPGPPGQPGPATLACSADIKTLTGTMSTLNEEDLIYFRKDQSTLPYLMKNTKKTTKKLGLFTATQGNMTNVPKGRDYIQDAMVIYDVDIDLPPVKRIKDDNFSVKMELDLMKVTKERSKVDATEILCLIGENDRQVCSGTQFTIDKWKHLINPEFGNGDPVINSYFSNQIALGIQKTPPPASKGLREFKKRITVYFDELFARDGQKLNKQELIALLYGPENQNTENWIQRSFRFLVADDSYIDDVKLYVNFIDSCEGAEVTERTVIPYAPSKTKK